MAKSGKVTIRLSPREVKRLMEHPPHAVDEIMTKVYDAAVLKFPEAKSEMNKAWDIFKAVTDTDEMEALEVQANDLRRALNVSISEINEELHRKRAETVQVALDEAGITEFRAQGYGLVKASDFPITNREAARVLPEENKQ